MSSYAPESAQYAVSEFLYSDILLVWERMMACDPDWRAFDRNISEAVVSDCAIFIVSRCVLRLALYFFFRTLVGLLAIAVLRGTT